MIGHIGDPKNRWSLSTFRRCPVQSSRVGDEPGFPSYQGDVADATFVPGGTENPAHPQLTHDYLSHPPNRGHPHHQQLYFISYKQLKQYAKNK